MTSATHGEVLERSGVLDVGQGLVQARLLGSDLGDRLLGGADLWVSTGLGIRGSRPAGVCAMSDPLFFQRLDA